MTMPIDIGAIDLMISFPKSNAPRQRGVRRGRRPSQTIVSTFVAEKGPFSSACATRARV